jgi:hypothetical protein
MNCDKLIHERVTLFRNISDIVPKFIYNYVRCRKFYVFTRRG